MIATRNHTIRRVAGACCIAAALALSSANAADAVPSIPSPTTFRPFAPDSVFNLPLRVDAPIDPDSPNYVNALLTDEFATGNRWINSSGCGMPIYWAAPGTARTAVTIDPVHPPEPALQRAWSSVPMPDDAAPANCGDQNLAVLQRQGDGTVSEWEFWKATELPDGSWMARWGGVTQNVAVDGGVASKQQWQDLSAPLPQERTANRWWNVTASSISMIAGVITIDDMNNGRINHAVAMALGAPANNRFRWPAQRTDGRGGRRWALPEGSRLRLDPHLDLSTVAMTPLVAMIARAAQRYGIVVRDQTGADDVFISEQPRPGRPSPIRALLDGQLPDEALRAFPWRSLQLLAAPACPPWERCTWTGRASLAVDGSRRGGGPLRLDTRNSRVTAPRRSVAWDLDGDGSYETAGGTAVTRTVTLPPGRRTVGVRIISRDGAVITTRRSVIVADGDVGPIR